MNTPEHFAELVQTFFCDYLIKQRDLSPRTVSAYRDTFRLLIELSAAPTAASVPIN
jgi:integrase/recombinase XerD